MHFYALGSVIEQQTLRSELTTENSCLQGVKIAYTPDSQTTYTPDSQIKLYAGLTNKIGVTYIIDMY
ncbi:hypothetical protein DSM106972_096320 [Dulcicalothrix desertica PCC 7102]|uniref:Uncharacterized protein n=1 Tax=Dulcicalothrix desertica PCC 7102 TaxID=232991 RepID=A0A3S1BYF6_9CYAN|nr:hypothetical protein DSM106972_096320 [Dulcicalothrix desertica PCC 7102]